MYRSIHVSSDPEDAAAGRLLSNCCTGASCRSSASTLRCRVRRSAIVCARLLDRFPALLTLQLLEVVESQPVLPRRADHSLVPLPVRTERLALGRGTLRFLFSSALGTVRSVAGLTLLLPGAAITGPRKLPSELCQVELVDHALRLVHALERTIVCPQGQDFLHVRCHHHLVSPFAKSSPSSLRLGVPGNPDTRRKNRQSAPEQFRDALLGVSLFLFGPRSTGTTTCHKSSLPHVQERCQTCVLTRSERDFTVKTR